MNKVHIYLISDSTGETVSSVAKSAMAHFQNIEVEEHLWSFVQTKGKIDKLKSAVLKNKGIVMFTLVDKKLAEQLTAMCKEIDVLCIPILEKVVSDLANYLKISTSAQTGKQHELNEEYFSKVDAVNYALAHDDGQAAWDLDDADIILVGPSRTSKSPTCLYLAYKGYKTANVPYVSGCNLPDTLFNNNKSLIVGLTLNHEILVQIRKNRILSLSIEEDTRYINNEEVEQELKEARKICNEHNWPIIDVSRRSVEETAALILQYYEKKKIRGLRDDQNDI